MERKINKETESSLEKMQETSMSDLAEIESFDVNSEELSEVADYNELRLESLLERMNEFDYFTAEEQAIVLKHQGIYHDELAEQPPEVLEEFLSTQEADLSLDFNLQEVEELENFAVEDDLFTMNSIAPMSASSDHGDIISNPFNLDFNVNESVCLNTGAAIFRTNILNLPGRNGFGVNLDLVYDSSRADLQRLIGNRLQSQNNLHGLGLSWIFDLPYILDNVLYIPGRGRFVLNGNQIQDYTLQDMRLANNTTFVSGTIRSNRSLSFHDGTVYYFNNEHIIGMHDRFNNTIRFEYGNIAQFSNLRLLTRIVDTNGRLINLAYSVSGTNRVITVTSPDSSVYTITLSPVTGHSGLFQLIRVRNQVNIETSFTYDVSIAQFNFNSKTPNQVNHTLLLRRVNYPSGAQLRFEYVVRNNNLGRNGSRQVWQVSARELFDNNRANQRTTFTYDGDATAFPQHVDRPPTNHTYGATVLQNNGLRTVYRFNYRHLNISERTYNVNTLLSEQVISYNNDRLPTSIVLTEHRSGRSRITRQTFTYNRYGQVLTELSPLAQGVANARYTTTNTYDNRFGLLLITTSMPDANTTVRQVNTLSADGRFIIGTNIDENNIRLSRKEFLHDTHGNTTEIREFPNAGINTFIATQITYNSGTVPSRIQTIDVRGADGNLLGNIGRSFTYDTMWLVTSETDPNGDITRWQYDRIGRITRADYPNGGHVTYIYNDTQNTLRHRTVLGAEYVYRYDGLGNLLTITDPNNIVIRSNIYDLSLRVIEQRNAQGIASSQRTTMQYDIFDRITEMQSLNASGAIMRRERREYFDINDAALNSRIVTTIHGGTGAPNIATFTQYDRFGRKNQEGTNGGRIINYTHDTAGRVTRETSPGIDNIFTYNIHGITSIRNIEGRTSRTTYDHLGRTITATDHLGNTQHLTYDALGRIIQHRVPFERIGNVLHHAETRYNYDNNGNQTRISKLINRSGQPAQWAGTENTYRHNNLISSQTGGASGIRTDYTYNLAGDVLTKRVGGSGNSGSAVGGAVTTYTYNTRGQLIQSRDAMNQNESYTYDTNGLLLTRTDRNGTLFRNTYDNMGRMTREEAVGNNAGHRAFTFTPTGTLRTQSNGAHTITYTYDAQGRMVQQDETGGISLIYTYNTADNITRARKLISNVEHLNVAYTFDTAGRVRTVTSNGVLQVTYAYDANGNRISQSLGNGVIAENTYNLANLVTAMTNRRGNINLSRFDYTYYLDGNISTVAESLEGSNRNITYTYDVARRLIREAGGEMIKDYIFDARGNRILMGVMGVNELTGENYTASYAYDLNNRLTLEEQWKSPCCAVASKTSFTYDNNGNQLTEATTRQATETKTYNVFNQLISVTRPATADTLAWNVTYIYRADGLRYSTTVNGVVTVHGWDRGNIVMEQDANGAVTNRYHRGVNHLIRSDHHGWYLSNPRGDIAQRANAQGNVTNTYRYDSFGNELNQNSNDTNPFRFAGEYLDRDSGTYYLRARNYNPAIGRFTQEDPHWGIHNMQSSTNAILQSGNLYAYAMNNPVRWVDPTGRFVNLAMSVARNAVSTALQRTTSTQSGSSGTSSGVVGSSVVPIDQAKDWISDRGQGAVNWTNQRQIDVQRAFWRTGAQLFLRDHRGFYSTAYLLEHSLQDNPGPLIRCSNSRIGGLIANSLYTLRIIDNLIANSTDGTISFDYSLEFRTGELFYGLQKADMTFTGNLRNDGIWVVTGTVRDVFDFDNFRTITSSNGFLPSIDVNLGNVANDAALISQNTGAIVPFQIEVDFRVYRRNRAR